MQCVDELKFDELTIDELTDEISADIPILIGSNANEGFFSLMYADMEMFPNKELTIDQREMTEEEYYNAVEGLFNYYPSNVCLSWVSELQNVLALRRVFAKLYVVLLAT